MSSPTVPPGLSYFLEHHHPADGSGGENEESTQHLVNPRQQPQPGPNETVLAWIKQRVEADGQMKAAAARRLAEQGEEDQS